jgi:hypothetical protein
MGRLSETGARIIGAQANLLTLTNALRPIHAPRIVGF